MLKEYVDKGVVDGLNSINPKLVELYNEMKNTDFVSEIVKMYEAEDYSAFLKTSPASVSRQRLSTRSLTNTSRLSLKATVGHPGPWHTRSRMTLNRGALAGGARREMIMVVHIIMHILIVVVMFGALYAGYRHEGLHETNCFAWYSSIMASWKRTPVQNTYCSILQGAVKTITVGVDSITKPPTITHFVANVFGVLFTTIMTLRTAKNAFDVYNNNVLKLTCALLKEDILNVQAQDIQGKQDALCVDFLGMIKNLPAVAAPAAAVPVGFAVPSLRDMVRPSAAPARAASQRPASRAASQRPAAPRASPTADEQRELEEALRELNSGSTSGSSGTSGTSRRTGRTRGTSTRSGGQKAVL